MSGSPLRLATVYLSKICGNRRVHIAANHEGQHLCNVAGGKFLRSAGFAATPSCTQSMRDEDDVSAVRLACGLFQSARRADVRASTETHSRNAAVGQRFDKVRVIDHDVDWKR
jgi:hypothetical protein